MLPKIAPLTDSPISTNKTINTSLATQRAALIRARSLKQPIPIRILEFTLARLKIGISMAKSLKYSAIVSSLNTNDRGEDRSQSIAAKPTANIRCGLIAVAPIGRHPEASPTNLIVVLANPAVLLHSIHMTSLETRAKRP